MKEELFNQEFEGIAGQLKSYILRITASIADTEDIVGTTPETLCRVKARIK